MCVFCLAGGAAWDEPELVVSEVGVAVCGDEDEPVVVVEVVERSALRAGVCAEVVEDEWGAEVDGSGYCVYFHFRSAPWLR